MLLLYFEIVRELLLSTKIKDHLVRMKVIMKERIIHALAGNLLDTFES